MILLKICDIQYDYGRDSNRLWRKILTNPSSHYDWLYAYQGLQHLNNAQRGTRNDGHAAITDPQLGPCWTPPVIEVGSGRITAGLTESERQM